MNSEDFDENKIKILHQLKAVAQEMQFINEQGNGNEFEIINNLCGFLDIPEEDINRLINEEIAKVAKKQIKDQVNQRLIANREQGEKPKLRSIKFAVVHSDNEIICENCRLRYIPKSDGVCPGCEVFK